MRFVISGAINTTKNVEKWLKKHFLNSTVLEFTGYDLDVIDTTWNTYHLNGNSSMVQLYDLAFDIWLGADNEILNASSSPSTEIMIWYSYTPNTDPIGKILADDTIFWGIDFMLYGGIGTGHDFVTYSFLYNNKFDSNNNHLWDINDVDLNDVFSYLMKNDTCSLSSSLNQKLFQKLREVYI